MSLGTKNQRGSAIGTLLPWRNWQSEPDGVIDVTARVSLLKLVVSSAFIPISPGIQFQLGASRIEFALTSTIPQMSEADQQSQFALEGD